MAVAHGLLAPPARCLSLAQVCTNAARDSCLMCALCNVPDGTACVACFQVLHAHLELPRCILGEAAVDYRAASAMLARFTRKQELL